MPYIDDEELRAYVNDSGSQNQAMFEDACESATRQVDAICGRYFTQDDTATARLYWPCNTAEVHVDDISTTTGLLVAVDTDGNGTYDESWTISTDFFLEPVNPSASGITWPYTEIVATLASKSFVLRSHEHQRPTVQVTAKWGWADIPSQVKQATKILAARALALGNAPLDVYGVDAFGGIRVQAPRSAMDLLRPFIIGSEYAVA